MSSPSTRCPACGASSFSLRVRCRACGFTQLPDEGQRFDYDAVYDEAADYNAKPPDEILDHYRRAPNTSWALDRLRRLRKAGLSGRLLEIGASQGAFLVLARELGFDVRGFELSRSSVRYGHENLHLNDALELRSLESRGGDERSFDIVCAFEVLEHAVDPLEFLSMLRTWMRPGGFLLLSVPNGHRLGVRLGRREPQDYPPHHFSYWTVRALAAAVRRSGLEVFETRTSRLTHSDLLGLAAPGLAARRAADIGSLRPVGHEAAEAGLPLALRILYPPLRAAGWLAAAVLNLVPELGSRLMLMGQRPLRKVSGDDP